MHEDSGSQSQDYLDQNMGKIRILSDISNNFEHKLINFLGISRAIFQSSIEGDNFLSSFRLSFNSAVSIRSLNFSRQAITRGLFNPNNALATKTLRHKGCNYNLLSLFKRHIFFHAPK